MNFKKIGILDDSIGGIKVLNSLKEIYTNENFIYFADLKEYPYGLKKLSSEKLAKNSFENISKEDLKLLVITNPAISMSLKEEDIKIIDGINRSIEKLNYKNSLVLGSKLSLNLLEKRLGFNIDKVDAQMLINLATDGDKNYYIITKLISEYIKDKKEVILFDSNLLLFKDYFLNYNKNLKVYSLEDFILEDVGDYLKDDLRHLASNRQKVKYYTSDYRIAFYKSAEEFFDDRFSSVKIFKE
ncbi:hypothetical protein [Peptoniphilus stercorisuis]|uniref:Glutamate racemase n=1 Tax=Peptoniphilus stercorisuis TaxID=1436965 RepID=A0ABS4KDQ3_9FIRM|nr:hypothetical protein [Peptoniphilus stercorisuis]MBP2025898.1 glutamate racemase [Peptoniphilus stercorisuis]